MPTGVSVTNVLATNSPSAPAIGDGERRRRVALSQKLQSHALLASTTCGVLCAAGCLAFGGPLLRLMGSSAELLPVSLPYLRIRCLAAPAVMIMNACNGVRAAEAPAVAHACPASCLAPQLAATVLVSHRLGPIAWAGYVGTLAQTLPRCSRSESGVC